MTGRRRWLQRWLAGALVMAVLIVGGTAFRVWQVARGDDRAHADMIVVLGAAQYDGRPSKIFAARLLHAKTLYEQGVAARIVTVGGNRSGDAYTEAAAGARFLREEGTPAAAVIAVERGGDTLSSLRAVANMAAAHGWGHAVLVSDPWHSQRAKVMAEDIGLTVTTSPTHSGPVVRTRKTQARYIVRETGALLHFRLTRAPSGSHDTGVG